MADTTAQAGELTERDERIRRLMAAVEGECNGLAIDEATARAILAYVDTGFAWPSPSSIRDRAANESARAGAVPDCRVADRGFRWDIERQHHVPHLLVEFEPVPANSPSDAKGWRDRDALAAALSDRARIAAETDCSTQPGPTTADVGHPTAVPAGYRLTSGFAYGQRYYTLEKGQFLEKAYERGAPLMFAFFDALASAPAATGEAP